LFDDVYAQEWTSEIEQSLEQQKSKAVEAKPFKRKIGLAVQLGAIDFGIWSWCICGFNDHV
jgi:hypothetical protein